MTASAPDGKAEALKQQYDKLRLQLRWLQAAPARDDNAISRAIDELEALQLQIKAVTLGFEGNNPND